MSLSRSLIGASLGVVAAIVWQAFGAGALLAVAALGVAGFAAGWVLEHPNVLIDLLKRLER
jgi:hypothetical protein